MEEPREFSDLERDLASLSDRLEQRVASLKATGRLTSAFELAAGEIHARRRELIDRVDEAIRCRQEWSVVKAELTRDYRSLFDNLAELEQSIDKDFAHGGH